jgi:hypothetical protein
MSLVEGAIQQGIEEGFEQVVADRCDGYDEPEDRCMMRPKDGCACMRVQWRKSKWWEFVKEPPKPNHEAVVEAIVKIALGSHLGGDTLPVKKKP